MEPSNTRDVDVYEPLRRKIKAIEMQPSVTLQNLYEQVRNDSYLDWLAIRNEEKKKHREMVPNRM